MKFSTHNPQSGFSLFEMVIVIFLLGLMMTLTLTNYRGGETQKRVAIAADIVTNTIRNAQNYTLTGKQTTNANPNCRVPANFYVTFEYANSSQASVRATNNCGGDDLIETFTFPANTRIQPNSLLIWNTFGNASTAVSSLNFVFHTPYANMEAKKDTDPYAKFNSAQITVESNNGEYAKVVPVDGISGRIGN